MKSKILHLVLLSLPGVAFVSCDNEEEPQVNPLEYRISWIPEFSNPEHPIINRTFTYFGGEFAHNMPVVQGSILRPYYLPLQYQGILGRQSVGLVKEMTAASNDRSFVTTFSYDISTSVYSSIVESYSASRDGKETTFTLGWDTAD